MLRGAAVEADDLGARLWRLRSKTLGAGVCTFVNGTRRRFFMARAIAGLLNLPHKRLFNLWRIAHVHVWTFYELSKRR